MLFQINKGTKSFGPEVIFENIQFEVKNTEKIAVIGRNGCGKSTLLKTITGELSLDSGTIHQANGITIGYLHQKAFDDESCTVQEEFDKIYEDLLRIKEQMDRLAQRMATDYSEQLLEQYSRLQSEFERRDGYTYQQEQLSIFTKFGFTFEDLSRPLSTFSGGQKTRIAFVKLLLTKPDILLLDEPTNHLDLETIEWLEGYLKRYPKAVVLVSHDRMFLDRIVEEVYELEFTSLRKYVGNYSNYVVQKENDAQRQMDAYKRQQKEIERLEMLIEKFRYKKNKAAFAQSKIKYLDRMERIEAPTAETKNFKAHFHPRIKGGKQVLLVDQLTIGYDHPLCTISLEIQKGQRIAVLGPNGKGKSTFVKTLMGYVPPLGGEFMFGHQIEVGYFDQQLAQFSTNKTVLDELWDDFPEYDRTQIRTTLGSFLFSADDVFKTVDVLSGGEKVRLSLAKLMLQQGNFLILDEPTNHLDILGKEALEEALSDYDGTILFVSHDRYFIQKIATAILVIDENGATYYPMNYQDYSERVEVVEQKEEKEKPQKEVKKRVDRSRDIKKLEKQIDEMETKLEELRNLRFEPEYYHDYRKMNELDEQIDEVHNQIAHLMDEWEACHESD
ncbi:MAG: ABC-F family ATP-binding cassette domain-containing protein [Erysipelotrichaceae bacterium]|nr:ABC-F family ATP-binding cassette domain-containing protein [Erysipelotrichaceae bacterium]